jgi:hypothetical protein
MVRNETDASQYNIASTEFVLTCLDQPIVVFEVETGIVF